MTPDREVCEHNKRIQEPCEKCGTTISKKGYLVTFHPKAQQRIKELENELDKLRAEVQNEKVTREKREDQLIQQSSNFKKLESLLDELAEILQDIKDHSVKPFQGEKWHNYAHHLCDVVLQKYKTFRHSKVDEDPRFKGGEKQGHEKDCQMITGYIMDQARCTCKKPKGGEGSVPK